MVKIIYGNKGSGKTKTIINTANQAVENSDSNVAYLYVNKKYMFELNHKVRFIDTSEYGIKGAYLFLGFLNGLIASNFDLKMIFVDGFLKHMDRPMEQLEDVIAKIKDMSEKHSVDVVLSVSADYDQLPQCFKKLIA